jgi:DNA-binding CsgD family transcriptional regulator
MKTDDNLLSQAYMRLRAATENYEQAKTETKRILDEHQDLPLGHPDGNLARRKAADLELRALRHYRETLSAYSDLFLSGQPAGKQQGPDAIALEPLTSRETEVLALIAKGLSSKQISRHLGISFKTATCHRARIMDKLGIHKVAGLVCNAIREKLIIP